MGHGTQRVEDALQALFPKARIARVDRDSTARKGSLKQVLEQVRDAEVDILVGTQMLAKGHDYPGLTLVGVLDSDSALFSADFRAAERLFSQLVQVAGRAGRAERAGEVLIQTDFPDAPALRGGGDATTTTRVRRRGPRGAPLAGFPPFAHLALLRAESKKSGEAVAFLRSRGTPRAQAPRSKWRSSIRCPRRSSARPASSARSSWCAPGRRAALQPFVRAWKAALDEQGERRVRWSLDVDPQDV